MPRDHDVIAFQHDDGDQCAVMCACGWGSGWARSPRFAWALWEDHVHGPDSPIADLPAGVRVLLYNCGEVIDRLRAGDESFCDDMLFLLQQVSPDSLRRHRFDMDRLTEWLPEASRTYLYDMAPHWRTP